jgi:uncharacterized protein YkwD
MVKKLDNHDFLEFLNKTYGTKDSDGDGICDEVEVMIGTDPRLADTDGDGMSDGAEIRAGRNPLGPGDFRNFQDFFEPHEGNNYRPQALHPKRLLFYAASAAVLKVLLVAFVVSLPITAWLSPDVMKAQSAKIIAMTNEVRDGLHLAPLKESVDLSMAAYDKAQDMLIGQYFAHTGPDGRGVRDWLAQVNYSYAVAGENLAMGFTEPRQVVEAWVKSPTHYANLIDPEYSEIGVGMTSGNYHGEETTLVAQYFGEPKQVAKLQAVEVTNQPVKLAQASDQVATKKPVMILARPEIIEPKAGAVYNKAEIEVVVRAPGAERLTLKSDEKLLVTSAKSASDEYARLKVSLPEAEKQELVVVAAIDKQEELSVPVLIVLDQTPPQVNPQQFKLWLEDVSGTEDKVLKFEAVLEPAVSSAKLAWADMMLDLTKVGEGNLWSGQAVLYGKQMENSSITLPVLTVSDALGNSQSYDVPAANIRPVSGSWTERYFFLKNNPSPMVSKMFDMTTIVYRIMIIMVGLALALALSLERQKQERRTVTTTAIFALFILFLLII